MSFYETMPKVELHLHLEGAIPLDALWSLIEQAGGDPGVRTRQDLDDRFAYRDFAHFIETWVWKNRYLSSYGAFTFAAEAVAARLAAQNVEYAEAFFSPTDFAMHDLWPGPLAAAIRKGLDRVNGTRVALIVDLVRETGPARAARTLAAVEEVAPEAGVIGVGLGGSEVGHPPEQYAGVYHRAAEAGLRLTAHAGEAAGPKGIWGALRALNVERIGHGVQAVEDLELIEHLVTHQIPLETCPTSNLRTGVVANWDTHPVRDLIAAGVKVTINTDDPAMFNTTLAGEYEDVETEFGLDRQTMRRLSLNAVEASWAVGAERARLRNDLEVWWSQSG